MSVIENDQKVLDLVQWYPLAPSCRRLHPITVFDSEGPVPESNVNTNYWPKFLALKEGKRGRKLLTFFNKFQNSVSR